jgi:putative transposase
VARTKKIRLYPTSKQRQVLAQWFGAARWTYNQCVHGIEQEGIAKNKKELRNYCINKSVHLSQKTPWVLDTPYDIRNEAMCDVLKAYTTSFALLKAKHITKFKMMERTLKDASTSIVIHSKHWKNTKSKKILYAAAFKKAGAEETLQTSEALPETILYDCRLQRTRLGHYYFCLLLPGNASENQARVTNTAAEPTILAIDPGVRTFLTGYEPATGKYVEWGKGDMTRVERLLGHLDDLMSRTAKSKSKRQRYTMRKAQMRLRLRVHNLVDEFHKKLVVWLVQSYELVLLPHYETSGMVNRMRRKISRPSVRAMLTWSFYRFKQRLLMNAAQSLCTVVMVDEHHTTMTCGECGHLHRNVGGSKVFECPLCQTTLPRDWNAARNIFLRYVSTTSTSTTTMPASGHGLGLVPVQHKLDATTDGTDACGRNGQFKL